MTMTRRFVLDTSLFVNPYARGLLGDDPDSAMLAFLRKIKKLDAEFFMPPSVFNELKNFLKPSTLQKCEPYIKKRAPNLYAIYLPAAVLYDFIDDVRVRLNKGLRLAEEFAKDNRPDNEEKLRKLREKYRNYMRAGIVDSTEDFELLLLAKELDATVVSSDEGIINFANKIGCEWVDASKFISILERLK
jgi:RNA ligase partner protein